MYSGRQTFGDLVTKRVEDHSSAIAVKFETNQLDFETLHIRANQFANAMLGLGSNKGDTCAVMLPNGADYLTT